MKRILLLLMVLQCSYIVFSQSTIEGVISDEIGGVPYVNISIKNSEKGTITNTEGAFEIFAKANDTLLISHVAYQPEEIVVDENKILNVVLSDRVSLDEIILVSEKSRRISCGYSCKYEIITISVAEEPNLKLYPNPSPNGVFNLSIDKDYNTLEIQVTSISGQIILSEIVKNNTKTVKIDVSKYPTGLYIINTIVDGKHLPTKKAIIR